MTTTTDLSVKDLLFTIFMAMVKRVHTRPTSSDNSNLDSLLKSWNLKRVIAGGDGNCLFTSVAYSLIERIRCGDETLRHSLICLGVPEGNLQDTNVQRFLRIKMVDEWSANPSQDQGFLQLT